MDKATVTTLFRKFAAPLAAYGATSPQRRELAEMLARHLWMAMIAGPELEEDTWEILRTTAKLDDDSLQVIQQMYVEQMKPAVSEQERSELWQQFQRRPNKQA